MNNIIPNSCSEQKPKHHPELKTSPFLTSCHGILSSFKTYFRSIHQFISLPLLLIKIQSIINFLLSIGSPFFPSCPTLKSQWLFEIHSDIIFQLCIFSNFKNKQNPVWSFGSMLW